MPKLTSLFAATTLVAGIIAVHLWQQLRDSRQLVAQLQQEHRVQPEPRSPVTRAIEPVAVSQPMPPAAPADSPPQAIPPPAAMPTALAARLNQVATNSSGSISISLTAMNTLFPELDKALGLNPEEANSLVPLLLRNAPQAEIDALLGSARAQQLQEYQKTLESRRRMNDLKNTLAQSSFPLSDEQMDRVAPISRAEQVRRDEQLRARTRPTDPRAQLDFDEETIKATEASYGRVIAAARNVLSPEQLGIMQNSMNSVVTSQRQSLQTRRARLAAGGSVATEAVPIPAGSGSQTPVIIFTQPVNAGQTSPGSRP